MLCARVRGAAGCSSQQVALAVDARKSKRTCQACSNCGHTGVEPRAFRMQSGCDTTTPCARVVGCVGRDSCRVPTVQIQAAACAACRRCLWCVVPRPGSFDVPATRQAKGSLTCNRRPVCGLLPTERQHPHASATTAARTCAATLRRRCCASPTRTHRQTRKVAAEAVQKMSAQMLLRNAAGNQKRHAAQLARHETQRNGLAKPFRIADASRGAKGLRDRNSPTRTVSQNGYTVKHVPTDALRHTATAPTASTKTTAPLVSALCRLWHAMGRLRVQQVPSLGKRVLRSARASPLRRTRRTPRGACDKSSDSCGVRTHALADWRLEPAP